MALEEHKQSRASNQIVCVASILARMDLSEMRSWRESEVGEDLAMIISQRCCLFVMARGSGECSLERGSSESGGTYPGAIYLSPRIIGVDSFYLLLNTGWRFSKKALRASWASSLLKAMRILDSS